MSFCAWKDCKGVAASLRKVYEAATAEQAAHELKAFEKNWGAKYPSIAPAWRRAWAEVVPFFAFSPAIRRLIYTTVVSPDVV
jgi:putative transposase